MKIVYIWVGEYKQFKDYEVILDRRYSVKKENISGYRKFTIEKNSTEETIDSLLYGENVNVSAIAGKNGTGKTTTLEIIRLFFGGASYTFDGFMVIEIKGVLVVLNPYDKGDFRSGYVLYMDKSRKYVVVSQQLVLLCKDEKSNISENFKNYIKELKELKEHEVFRELLDSELIGDSVNERIISIFYSDSTESKNIEYEKTEKIQNNISFSNTLVNECSGNIKYYNLQNFINQISFFYSKEGNRQYGKIYDFPVKPKVLTLEPFVKYGEYNDSYKTIMTYIQICLSGLNKDYIYSFGKEFTRADAVDLIVKYNMIVEHCTTIDKYIEYIPVSSDGDIFKFIKSIYNGFETYCEKYSNAQARCEKILEIYKAINSLIEIKNNEETLMKVSIRVADQMFFINYNLGINPQKLYYIKDELLEIRDYSSIHFELSAGESNLLNIFSRTENAMLNRNLEIEYALKYISDNLRDLEDNQKQYIKNMKNGKDAGISYNFYKDKLSEFYNSNVLEKEHKERLKEDEFISYTFSQIKVTIINNRKFNLKKLEPYAVLLLDEADNSLHPFWQKSIVSMLIDFIQKRYRNIQFHFLFTTHSPVILSDIPKSNVFFISNEEWEKRNETFAANISSLYNDSFFMENGCYGNIASRIIQVIYKAIDYMKKNEDKKADFVSSFYYYLKKNVDLTDENDNISEKINIFKASHDIDYEYRRILKLIGSIGEPLWRNNILSTLEHNIDTNELDIKLKAFIEEIDDKTKNKLRELLINGSTNVNAGN